MCVIYVGFCCYEQQQQGRLRNGNGGVSQFRIAPKMKQSHFRRFSVRAQAYGLAYDESGRAGIQAGLNILADAVALSLGPKGIISSLLIIIIVLTNQSLMVY